MENENKNITTPEQNKTPHTDPSLQNTFPTQPFSPPEWTKNIQVSDKSWNLSESNAQPILSEKTVRYEMSGQEKGYDGQVTPDNEIPMWKQISIVFIGIIVVLALILGITGKETKETTAPSESTTAFVCVMPTTATAAPAATTKSTTLTSSLKETSSADDSKKDTAEKTSGEEPSAPEKEISDKKDYFEKEHVSIGEDKAKKEIIKYFNDSINRVKPESVKIVKNFEKRTHNAEKLVLPAVIKAIGEKMLNQNMTDVTESVEYTTAEEISVNFPIAYSEKSSELTAEDVKSAVCTDMGNEYEITIELETTVDPEPGKGVARAVSCLNVPAVRDTAPEFITDFSAEYYDCVIRCRADKASGRIIWVSYTTPVLVKLGLDAGFTQFDAQIGLTFEKDYSIVY